MRAHIHTHTGNKSFVCDLCDIRFSRTFSFKKKHKLIHTGLLLYTCELCYIFLYNNNNNYKYI